MTSEASAKLSGALNNLFGATGNVFSQISPGLDNIRYEAASFLMPNATARENTAASNAAYKELLGDQMAWEENQAALNRLFQQTSADKAMAFEAAEAEKNRVFQQTSADKAMAFEAAEAEKNRQFQTEMSNTSYQRAIKDLKAAGLNPILAYTNGASTPSGSSARGSISSGSSARGSISSGSKGNSASPHTPAVANVMYSIGDLLSDLIHSATTVVTGGMVAASNVKGRNVVNHSTNYSTNYSTTIRRRG